MCVWDRHHGDLVREGRAGPGRLDFPACKHTWGGWSWWRLWTGLTFSHRRSVPRWRALTACCRPETWEWPRSTRNSPIPPSSASVTGSAWPNRPTVSSCPGAGAAKPGSLPVWCWPPPAQTSTVSSAASWMCARRRFAPMEVAVAETAMEYGGITPIGLPDGWPVFLDAAVAVAPQVVIGSGVRRSKLVLTGDTLRRLPGVTVLEGLGR